MTADEIKNAMTRLPYSDRRKAPRMAGVYAFFRADGRVLYVGQGYNICLRLVYFGRGRNAVNHVGVNRDEVIVANAVEIGFLGIEDRNTRLLYEFRIYEAYRDRGIVNYFPSVTEAMVREIRERFNTTESGSELAKIYGFCHATIANIATGATYDFID